MSLVTIIDIGSNSIKNLVATREHSGAPVVALKMRAIEARISAGISQAAPSLTEEGMTRGLEAVRNLLADSAGLPPHPVVLVATSAVRDAANGDEFRRRVRAATGHAVRLLSGQEEAVLIGRGLLSDPALSGLRDFHVFDLGGGSLECLAFARREIRRTVSLPLGCVRLTERCIPDPAAPIPRDALERIARLTRETFAGSGFPAALPAGATAIGTGGTLTTARAILGALENKPLPDTSPRIPLERLRALLLNLASQTLAERRRVPAMPSGRADVFPSALATLVAIAELGGFDAYHHSSRNLRWGLADESLS
ncbi:MAG: phosphatase [Opitutaceae bacterium]|jgi:exopolyphosphatase/guanosine-5'-triphosphate,3'-diphosphate pyrophosphatase|nr:phosphatase [Opitutaceae bacterium]